jgi:hypothetical protein
LPVARDCLVVQFFLKCFQWSQRGKTGSFCSFMKHSSGRQRRMARKMGIVTTSGCPRVAIRWCGDFQVRGVCHPFVMCTRLNVPIRIRGMLCNQLRVPFPPGFQNTGLRRFSNGLQLVPTPTAGTFRHPCEQTGSWPAVLQGSFRIVCLLGGLVDCISVCPRGM